MGARPPSGGPPLGPSSNLRAVASGTDFVPLRVGRAARPLTEDWRHLAVEPRGSTALGISFRPLQAEAMGLPPRDTLAALLGYEYQLIRLGALWNRMEPQAGVFDPASLDWQVEAAGRAGKQIVLAVGAVKTC